MCAATLPAAPSTSPPHRYDVDSTRVGASGHAETNRRGSAPRKVWVAASGSPSSTRSAPPPATTTCSSRRAAGVSSWASSTTTSRSPARRRSSASRSVSRWSAAAPRIQAGSKAPGADRAVTSSYSRSTSAAATHSGRSWAWPSRARSSGSRPSSTARISRSRSSPRKVRVGRARCTDGGHGGAADSPAACPASSSPRMTSCSGPLSSRGVGSPARAAASRRMPKPSDWWVRASGVVVVPPSRAVTASRSRAAASRVGASRRQPSAVASPSSTRWATTSTATVDRPVPGAPSTRSTGPRCSTTARWLASSTGALGATVTGRRRTSTQ